jgi:hypothetical protein
VNLRKIAAFPEFRSQLTLKSRSSSYAVIGKYAAKAKCGIGQG